MNQTEYLTIEEICLKLQIQVGTARNRLSRGDPMPPSVKIGRRRLFPLDELESWLKNRLQSNDGDIWRKSSGKL